MADISITAANVQPGAGAVTNTLAAGTTITAGETVYVSGGTLLLANADGTALTANCVGIALNGGSTGQPITYQSGGDITIGGTLVVGGTYVVSGTNPGGVAPIADVTTGWYPMILLIAKTTTVATIILRGANPLTAHS